MQLVLAVLCAVSCSLPPTPHPGRDLHLARKIQSTTLQLDIKHHVTHQAIAINAGVTPIGSH